MILIALLLSVLQPQESLQEVLQKMKKRTSTTNTMTALYEQTKTMTLLDEEVKTEGHIFFSRKSGSTRWQSTEGTIQQLDQKRYIAIFPDLKEVEIYPLKEKGSVLASLMGSPDTDELQKEFEIRLRSPAGERIELTLKPKTDFLKKRIQNARLLISPETYMIVGATVTEQNGDTIVIRFREMKINTGIPGQTFQLDLDSLRTKGYNIREHS